MVQLEWPSQWTVSAGASVSYDIQVSQDNGESWETVGVGQSTPNVDIDLSDFQSDRPLEVRIVATVGFETKEIARQIVPR
jgi:hypothetical protein